MHFSDKHLTRKYKLNGRRISWKILLILIIQMKGVRFECVWFRVGISLRHVRTG